MFDFLENCVIILVEINKNYLTRVGVVVWVYQQDN